MKSCVEDVCGVHDHCVSALSRSERVSAHHVTSRSLMIRWLRFNIGADFERGKGKGMMDMQRADNSMVVHLQRSMVQICLDQNVGRWKIKGKGGFGKGFLSPLVLHCGALAT